MRSGRPLFALFALAAPLAACGNSVHSVQVTPDAVETEHPVGGSIHFVPNEALEWRMSVTGIEGGNLVMGIGEPGAVDGRQVVIVASRVESSGVLGFLSDTTEDVVTHIDVKAGYPYKHRASLKRGDTLTTVEAAFATGDLDLTLIGKEGEQTLRRTVDDGIWPLNYPTSLLALRAWRPARGSQGSIEVLARTRVWRATVVMGAEETISTALGEFDVVRVDGVAQRLGKQGGLEPNEKRRFSLWFTRDELRLPVRARSDTRFGTANMELVRYQNPTKAFAVD